MAENLHPVVVDLTDSPVWDASRRLVGRDRDGYEREGKRVEMVGQSVASD